MWSRNLFAPVAASLVFVGCQFSASCGSGKNLRMDNAKEFVASTMERLTAQKPTEVTCPDKVKIEKGKTFVCTASFGAPKAAVTMTQTNDEGGVEITNVTGILIATKLETAVADQLGGKLNAHLKVDCGERVRSSTAGDRFTCTATDAKGASGKVTVIVKDDQGNVRFDLGAPPAEAAPAAGGTDAPADVDAPAASDAPGDPDAPGDSDDSPTP